MEKLENLLKEIVPKVEEYKANQEKRIEAGFNLFYLISDHYYRETFHSDILGALLSPSEKHGGDKVYVYKFIEMINEYFKKKNVIGIDIKNYPDPQVTLELPTDDGTFKGRIDIFVEGGAANGNKHCFVIENKLNNALDTEQQLPKYSRYLNSKKYCVDAFVYLPLDPHKTPDKSDWGKESDYINNRLVVIPAFKSGEINLINNWLEKIKEYGNDDAKFVISQYIRVLNNLTIDIMDNDKIVAVLTQKENLDTTLCILEQRDSIYNAIKSLFVEKIATEIQKRGYSVDYQNLDKIFISNSDYPSWLFVIERIGGNTNRYCRFLVFNKDEALITKKKIWEKEAPGYPFGWDYYDKNRGYWDNIETLKEMIGNDFVDDIINECVDSFKEIDEQDLPK